MQEELPGRGTWQGSWDLTKSGAQERLPRGRRSLPDLPPEEGGSQPAGGGGARGRGTVGNQMGAGPCAQGGRVEGSDPLKEQWEAPEEFQFYGRQGEQQTDTSGSQRILLFVC